MKRANLIATACFTAMAGVLTLMPVRAQDTGAAVLEKSILNFSAPVELPGMTLPAGTYVFKRPDANSARIIQVFTEDEKKILGTFLTVPTKRLEVTSENVVTFKEAREGAMPAVHYWYYPARETGHEFVYPKDQAMRIASRTGETVLSTEGEISANSTVTPIEGGASASASVDTTAPAASADVDLNASANPSGVDVDVNRQASASTAQPDSQVAQNNQDQGLDSAIGAAPAGGSSSDLDTVGTSGSADQDANATDRLPTTASPLALSALLGLLSLGGAASLRRARR